ncbi:helix-hairpin-helix domain-containing protein [Streptomyces sp. NPDC002513]
MSTDPETTETASHPGEPADEAGTGTGPTGTGRPPGDAAAAEGPDPVSAGGAREEEAADAGGPGDAESVTDGGSGNTEGATDSGSEDEASPTDGGSGDEASATGQDVGSDPASATGDGDGDGGTTDSGDGEGASAQVSEAQAELAAQRVERERIERRKSEKKEPVEAGGKLSGKAADLLAAVRAVESGAKPVPSAFGEPAPAPRRPVFEPVRRARPAAPPVAAAGPAAESVAAVGAVLAEGGAPEALAPQAAAALGDGVEARLRADPWLLLRVPGVRPEQADGFARALLGAECRPDDERRARAVTVWLLEQAALAGHTALEVPALQAALTQRSVPDPEAAVRSTIAEGEALVFQDVLERQGRGDGEDGEDRPVRVLIGLERYALAEESLADGLARLVDSAPKEVGPAQDWERAARAAHGSAAELIRAVAGRGLVLHTGGEASRAEPAALLRETRRLGARSWAATHGSAGRELFAALLARLGPAADAPGAQEDAALATVAGLLSGAEGPGRDADGTLDLDLLIVLDAPQLDVETAALLIESLPDGARLVLSGDPGVLWSAGPGRVFADLLAARVCPQIASRTPDPGPLGALVSSIGVGELPQVDAPGKEVVIVPVRDAGEAVHRTVQLVADSVPRAIGVPSDETQVITPGHGGAAGTRALNAALKERLNPGPGRFGGFDPGDRIVYSPVPGRALPGRVVTADAEGLHLECAGAAVVVPRERVEQSVRHGWALTAHQAVGQRWPAVVVVLPEDAAGSLSRPWVYTAFGRAVRHLSVVHGVEQALPRAVAEIPAKPRTTRLPALLRPQVPTTEG